MTSLNIGFAKTQAIDPDIMVAVALKNRQKLQRFLRRFERNPCLIEDLVQDIFLEVIKYASRYEARSSPETWIFGIAANLGRRHRACILTRRALYSEVQFSDEEIEQQPSDANCLNDMFVAQRLKRTQDAVAAMSRSLQMTFESVFICDMSYQQAADHLGVPVGTIRSRTSRIRELLRTC